jgi:Flp pilus assembly protein TadG
MKQAIKRGTEGAVLVEFLAVFLPLFAFFLGLVQFMFIQVANLVTGHAAAGAARAAMVVIPDDPKKIGGAANTVSGPRLAEITRAARIPLATLGLDAGDVAVALDKGAYGRDDPIKVTVTVQYPCRVPLGNLIACGGGSKTLVAEGMMPNQGVEWEY